MRALLVNANLSMCRGAVKPLIRSQADYGYGELCRGMTER